MIKNNTQISEKEGVAIQDNYLEVRKACKNCSKKDLLRLEDAFNYAKDEYADSRKESGELKIMHSLSVAHIVANEIGLRSSSVISAILHDIIDNPDQDIKIVNEKFGEDVATIVKGFKKLSMLHSHKVSFSIGKLQEALF